MSIAVIEAEHKFQSELKTGTPYIDLIGKIWDAYCKDIGNNWACF